MTSNNMTHPSHPKHPLELVDHKGLYTCDGCKMEGIGKAYRCNRCNFDLHETCMFPSPTITTQGQECHFKEKPPIGIHCQKPNCTECRCCDACGMTIMGFVYHCPTTDKDFHPKCVNLEAKIRFEDVTFSLQKHGPSNCAWCKRKLLKGAVEKIPGWSYVSEDEDEDYTFHVYCMLEMAQKSQLLLNSPSTSQGTELQKLTKGSKTNKWMKILKLFLKGVFSILLGDPTTLVAETMAHFLVEGLFHAIG